MTTKKKKNNHSFAKGILTGIAAGSAALAMFLYKTEEGRKEKEKLKGWMVMMKGEVIHKLENLKEVSKEKYEKIVDEASKKFQRSKGLSEKEIVAFNKRLKSKWKSIQKEAETVKDNISVNQAKAKSKSKEK